MVVVKANVALEDDVMCHWWHILDSHVYRTDRSMTFFIHMIFCQFANDTNTTLERAFAIRMAPLTRLCIGDTNTIAVAVAVPSHKTKEVGQAA